MIAHIFSLRHKKGSREFYFTREDIADAAQKLGIILPKNLGDIIYSVRYRTDMPANVIETQPKEHEWVIQGAGKGKYRFKLVRVHKIIPREELLAIKIPDATPEIIGAYALGDEQALLAKVRYNRLVDIFLGVAAFSLQNHLRTSVANIGQVEIDEIYVALDKMGRQFAIPVQAKAGNDRHGVVQTAQDIACCREKFPNLICRPLSVQFLSDDRIAMFELCDENGEIKVVDEKHYQLVPASKISEEELATYNR